MAKLTYELADGSYVSLEGPSLNHLKGLRDRDPARKRSSSQPIRVPLQNVVDDDAEHLPLPVMNFDEDEPEETTTSYAGDHLPVPKMF